MTATQLSYLPRAPHESGRVAGKCLAHALPMADAFKAPSATRKAKREARLHPFCWVRQELLLRDQVLRSYSKLEDDWRRIALLASAALKVQKERQHEQIRQLCRSLKTEGEAAA